MKELHFLRLWKENRTKMLAFLVSESSKTDFSASNYDILGFSDAVFISYYMSYTIGTIVYTTYSILFISDIIRWSEGPDCRLHIALFTTYVGNNSSPFCGNVLNLIDVVLWLREQYYKAKG